MRWTRLGRELGAGGGAWVATLHGLFGCIGWEGFGVVCSILVCCSSSQKSANIGGRADYRVKPMVAQLGSNQLAVWEFRRSVLRVCFWISRRDLRFSKVQIWACLKTLGMFWWVSKGHVATVAVDGFRSGNSGGFPQTNKHLCQLAPCKAAGFWMSFRSPVLGWETKGKLKEGFSGTLKPNKTQPAAQDLQQSIPAPSARCCFGGFLWCFFGSEAALFCGLSGASRVPKAFWIGLGI